MAAMAATAAGCAARKSAPPAGPAAAVQPPAGAQVSSGGSFTNTTTAMSFGFKAPEPEQPRPVVIRKKTVKKAVTKDSKSAPKK